MGPRAGLDGCEKSRPTPAFDPQTVQFVASRYTDCAIPAPTLNCNVCDLTVRKEHSYVALLLGDADIYFIVLFFKLSCIYALFVPSVNNMCKIVIMSIFFCDWTLI